MVVVRVDSEEIRRLATHLRSAVTEMERRTSEVLARLDGLEDAWPDDAGDRYRESLALSLGRLSRDLELLGDSAGELERLAGRLDRYLGASLDSSGTGVAGPSQPARPIPRGRKGLMQMMSASGLRKAQIDWGEPTFERTFHGQSHHGYTAQDYLNLAGQLPKVITAIEQGSEGAEYPHGSAERRVYDAFWGSSAIELLRLPDGRIEVIEGRHRLFACLELGIDPPVHFRRL